MALAVGGEKTKKATVNRAMRRFIARRGQERLLDLFGKLDWNDDFDYERDRAASEPVCGYQRLVSGAQTGFAAPEGREVRRLSKALGGGETVYTTGSILQ